MTAPSYTSPVLDAIAERAIAHLAEAPRGLTVRELAERIGAHPSTTYNVLRGASVAYGPAPFDCGRTTPRPGRRARWRLSAEWLERYQ